MPNYPTTRFEMLRAGYKLQSLRNCRRCAAGIELWQTRNSKWVSVDKAISDPDDHLQIVLHRNTCPYSDAFRLGAVNTLLATTRARITVALYEDGAYQFAVGYRITAAELRDELISAANKIQQQLQGATQ